MTLYSVLANTICVSFTFIYVAGFYLFRQQGPALSRNHPEVILSRLKAVALASIVIPAIVHVILPSVPLTLALGILPLKISLLTPLLLTIILFCGPLALMYFDEELPWQKHFDLQQELRMITSLLGQRNFIVAPVTEEFVFRACVICVLYHSGFSTAYLIFVSPMYFGLAHLHHAWENYHQWGANAKALKLAVSSSGNVSPKNDCFV
ncbi:hypothetical protein DFQ28_002151 [Apophysomyces sp. BC1034]|nr:hypothetical protein DFQ30_007610 [Apophysomyces sp. BC1015]KAG0179802.1 hypothetical protein DFQ29_001649 [Apophysomyces sp. BC1021]KAG0190372.1 hypothetical protein DFQ28_002151 [Apophysomyces sp. BC1034]